MTHYCGWKHPANSSATHQTSNIFNCDILVRVDSFITQDIERASEVGKLGSDILGYYLVGLTSTDKLNTHAALNVCVGAALG